MERKYETKSEKRDKVEVFSLYESNESYAEVVPSLGNNCFTLYLQGPILDSPTFEQFLRQPTSLGIPVLFPFPNRLKDGEFHFRGKRYPVNPARHGFVRDKAWQVVSTGAGEREGAWIKSRLDAGRYPDQILTQYPFPFQMEILYVLKESSLQMETSIRNTGHQDAPIGFGIHPYFHRPEEGTIQVPARKRWELDDSLPTGTLQEARGNYDLLHPRDLAKLVMDDIFTDLIPDSDGLVRCTLHDAGKRLKTVVEFDAKQFPHVVVYTTPAPRRAICIEPYTCPTDGFNLEQRGVTANMIVLRPNESLTLKLCIRGEASAD